MWVGTGMGFTVVVHHGGGFVKNPVLRLIKDLGYREYKSVKLWWKLANNGGEGEKPDSGRVGGLDGVGNNNNVEGKVMEDVENGKGCCDDEVGGLDGVGDNNNVEGEIMEDVENGEGCCDMRLMAIALVIALMIRCLQYGHNLRKCPLPPREPDDEPSNPDQAALENSQGSTSGTTTVAKKKSQTNDKGKQKTQGTTSGTTTPSSKKKAAATGITAGNKKVAGTTVAAKNSATGGKSKKAQTASCGPSMAVNDCGQRIQVDGVQLEIPQIPEYAKNLTVAQLLARMMAASNTWAQAVTGQQLQVQTTQSEVTLQEQGGVIPTQNSEVGQEPEDGPTNPKED
ncbi:Pectin methylesterase [Sesbania bispinosa]|nr:Pectin methylesterase [Sesbania bispinosa]